MKMIKAKQYPYLGFISLLILSLAFVFSSINIIKAQNSSLRALTPLNPTALFYQAGNFYQKSDYPNALKSYNTLVKAGYESGNLYFNLGNTYYKMGQKGMAILFYEKAKRLMPGDADLNSNLSFALRNVDEGNSNWQTDFYQFIISQVSLENLLILTSLLFFAFCIIFILFILFPAFSYQQQSGQLKPWCLGTIIGIAVILVISLSLTVTTGINHAQLKGVVIQSDGEVRFEPNTHSTTYYQLAEGCRIQILVKKNNWYLIQRRDGKLGWIEQKFVAEI